MSTASAPTGNVIQTYGAVASYPLALDDTARTATVEQPPPRTMHAARLRDVALAAFAAMALVCTSAACSDESTSRVEWIMPEPEDADAGDSGDSPGWYDKICRGGRWTIECAGSINRHHPQPGHGGRSSTP